MFSSIKKIAVVLFAITNSLTLFAQQIENQQPEMADQMRSNGKIYVVVTIIAIIFIGIVTYLFKLDRKITKLEKEISDK